MLEARAHYQLKNLLRGAAYSWPHNLTLSRLVGRSLRRKDHTLIELDFGSQDFWWMGLLIPLCLDSSSAVLILSDEQRTRLVNIELPRLISKGLNLALWEGLNPPVGEQVWLLDHLGLIKAFQRGFLKSRQLIIPGAEHLTGRLRESLAIVLRPNDWERLRRAHPTADSSILQVYQRLSRRLFAQATRLDAQVRMDCSEILALKDLLGLLGPLPKPWPALLEIQSQGWASWAELDHKMLNWAWHLCPLEPLQNLPCLLTQQPTLLITKSGDNRLFLAELNSVGFSNHVNVKLRAPNLQEPIKLFAPHRQPLPNTEVYSFHLLDQCRRLILGRSGLTVVLLDDRNLRQKLTTELAAEFGRRVVHEATAPESNGVVCCHWSWWLKHQDYLPCPEQLIVALLPLASLESPFTAARVEAYKHKGLDWFRDLLLPESLSVLLHAVAPLRTSYGRVAILDGRLSARSWGKEVLRTLEPWTPLQRLLPD